MNTLVQVACAGIAAGMSAYYFLTDTSPAAKSVAVGVTVVCVFLAISAVLAEHTKARRP